MGDELQKGLFGLISYIDKDKAALVSCDKLGETTGEISYRELRSRMRLVANHFYDLGLRPGDRVALALPDSVDHLIASWTAWSMGVVTVPLDSKRDTEEIKNYKIKSSGAKMVLTELPQSVEAPNDIKWMPDCSHPALILFTSGTTALPKGALLSLDNLIVNAQGVAEWLRITEQDRFLAALPLYHINSTVFTLALLLASGTVILPPNYSSSNFWRQCANTKATLTSIVQSILADQLNQKEEFERIKNNVVLSRMQIGSAPVVAHAAQEFIRYFGIPLYQGYGQTETALRVTGVPMDLPDNLYKKMVEENSIGIAMSWAQVEIADDNGDILKEGQEGELVVKGAAVMQGYVGGEEAFRNGYFLTGDVGCYRVIDGRKFFYLKGRKKEIIIKGGVNISPVAVENALKKVSSDIDQVHVVGVDHDRYGEEVGAVISWQDGVDSAGAMRRLKAELLFGNPDMPRYERPAWLVEVKVADLPATSTGKVQRTALKKSGLHFEPIEELLRTPEYKLVYIGGQSPLREASHTLYNHCWQPLTLDEAAYRAYLQNYFTVGALDKSGVLQGQISFKYEGGILTCVSICSAAFKPKEALALGAVPTKKEVEDYLLAGHDPVMNFHAKLGAKLIEVIPQGRPEDKSACGYTMLLRYGVPDGPVRLTGAPVSSLLIQAVLLLAQDLGVKEIFALSRPGGLSAYLYKKGR